MVGAQSGGIHLQVLLGPPLADARGSACAGAIVGEASNDMVDEAGEEGTAPDPAAAARPRLPLPMVADNWQLPPEPRRALIKCVCRCGASKPSESREWSEWPWVSRCRRPAGGSSCEWVGNHVSGWAIMGVGGQSWEWVGHHGSGWAIMGVGGQSWEWVGHII